MWSLAVAGPPADEFTGARSAPDRAHTARAVIGSTAAILNTAFPALAASKIPMKSVRLDEPRPTGAESRELPAAAGRDRKTVEHSPSGMAIQWRESREIVNADIVGLVRNYRRDGLPIVHLYQSTQNVLAIGLNNHGVPGIYFTRHVGG